MSCRTFRLCEFCQNPGIVRANGTVTCEGCRAGFESLVENKQPLLVGREELHEAEKPTEAND